MAEELYLTIKNSKNGDTRLVKVSEKIAGLFSAMHKPTIVYDDYYATTGETIVVQAVKADVTIFLEEPVEGEFLMNEISKIEGNHKVYIKTRYSKPTMVGESETYTIEEVGTGVRVVSYGSDYVKF